jgi:hypothetical protein
MEKERGFENSCVAHKNESGSVQYLGIRRGGKFFVRNLIHKKFERKIIKVR